jgi:hypothetical protein
LSIAEFAQRVGLYPAAVLAWESGRRPTPGWVPARLQGRVGDLFLMLSEV